jgi:hypothetical protein
MKTIVACDPGESGGFAIQEQHGAVYTVPMPATGGDICALLKEVRDRLTGEDLREKHPVLVLEDVPKYCGKYLPKSSVFVLAKNFGFVEGVAQSLGYRIELVKPHEWQKTFSLGTASRCASKSEWKNKLKAEAQRLFPELKVTLATADALLLLEFARINSQNNQ